MRVNGAHRDSGRGSCYAISIGCTISMCNMMHPHSTPTHSSPSQTDIILSSHSGCRVQMAMGQQCPLLRRATSSYPTRFLRIQLRSSRASVRKCDELASPKIRRLRGRRVAVLLFSHYPADPRPRRAAEALAAQGAHIDLICLRDGDGEPAHETYGNINVRRVRLK